MNYYEVTCSSKVENVTPQSEHDLPSEVDISTPFCFSIIYYIEN